MRLRLNCFFSLLSLLNDAQFRQATCMKTVDERRPTEKSGASWPETERSHSQVLPDCLSFPNGSPDWILATTMPHTGPSNSLAAHTPPSLFVQDRPQCRGAECSSALPSVSTRRHAPLVGCRGWHRDKYSNGRTYIRCGALGRVITTM